MLGVSPRRCELTWRGSFTRTWFCFVSCRTHLASAECAALEIGGYQHVGQARTPHGGGVSILVRDGVGVEVGVLEKEVPERATVTLRFSADVSLTIISAYFPIKSDVSSQLLDTLLGANGAMVIGADVNSHHVLWDPLRPSDDKGECKNNMRIANTGLVTRRQPGTAALSSPDVTLCRDCEISNWKSALSPDSDHHWITFDVFVGASLDVIAPSKPVRALYSWNKARWNDFKKLSDEFILRGMKRSAKGADAQNETVTRGTWMAAKRTIPKGKGVAPPFWTPELTKLDKMVQECKNERKRDALIRWRRKVLVDTARGRWKENVSKLSTTDAASWNLVKSIYAPRPLTSPVLMVVDGHPLIRRQQLKHWPKCTWPGQRMASPEWGPDREELRAFYPALVQAKVCYGIASWWFDTSLSDRERREKVQAQAAHLVAGIPKAANRDDAMREARLKPMNEVAHRRALEYCQRLKAKGAVHAKISESIFPPEHPINVRLAKVKHLYSTIDGTGKKHDATVLKLFGRVTFNTTTPGAVKADPPEKDKKRHIMRRVVRFRDFDYQVWTDGSVVLDVSSGAGALVLPKEGRREKVVPGAGSLACSYRAECVAMEAGLKRLVDVIELNQTHRTRVVAFTDSLLLLMALSTGPAVVEDAILRRIWDLIFRLVRLRVSVNFQFVFSHCGVPRNEAADKSAKQGNAKPQMYPAWITDIVTGVERQVRNEMYRVFEEGRMLRTHRSVLLDYVRPAPKHTKLGRLGESLLAQFRTGTSKHFGWLHRVLTRKTDRLECRWCRAQDIGGDAVEGHTLAKSAVDSADAPDLGIATRQSDPIICPLCNMVCARRQAGVVHLVKIHGLERECALAMTKNSRLATQTYKHGYTCHVCGDDLERREQIMSHMAPSGWDSRRRRASKKGKGRR
ncbi:unnamed protein product [Trypanosoma congolense IL3000]|uniref:WGS project CAEQ00000000 data, annotated contig 1257 n=1 Tax=Trypanosoma congolense (strain IL3000) TaxID=1068625 RepID=F9W4Z8_TRYCI|nr:unnamed protein product [Trypanosoma congolense IL3000]